MRIFPKNEKQVSDDVEIFRFQSGIYLGDINFYSNDINFYSMFLTIANERFGENVITKKNTILPTNKCQHICSTNSYHQVFIKIKIA